MFIKITIITIITCFFFFLFSSLRPNQGALILSNTSSLKEYEKKLNEKSIAIFSVTLNPPTLAHEEIIDSIRSMKNPDGNKRFEYVYIHITENDPTGHYKKDAASHKQRLEMSLRAFSRKEGVLLSKLPPLDSVKFLMKVHNLKVSYVMGVDSIDWMTACTEKDETEFFAGNTEPKSMKYDIKTKSMVHFSGRSIFEIKPEKIIFIDRAGVGIPEKFLNIFTEKFVIKANKNSLVSPQISEGMSSTAVRKLIKNGDIDSAQKLVATDLQETFSDFISLYR